MMKTPPPQLSILIVNYNGKNVIENCLASIRSNLTIPHEVIVVDNLSTDGSPQLIQANFPEVRLVENNENVGFARANNQAAELALGKYLLLLNNDTVLLNDLQPLIVYLEKKPEIGAIGIKMLGKDMEYRFSTGYFPSPLRLIKISSLYRKSRHFMSGDFPQQPESYWVDWVEGSFLCTPRDIWHQINGLDEGYFMYVEDFDYCKKIQIAGLQTHFYPHLAYQHLGGYELGRFNLIVKGFRRFHQNFSTPITRLAANFVLIIGLWLRILGSYCLYLLTRKEIHLQRGKICLKAIRNQ